MVSLSPEKEHIQRCNTNYHPLKRMCLVSKNDELRIVGKWYHGKKVGIEGNFVVASRVENVSSNLVFDTGK